MSTLVFQYRYPWHGKYSQDDEKQAKCDECASDHASVNHLDDHHCTQIVAEREHNPPGPPYLLVRGYR